MENIDEVLKDAGEKYYNQQYNEALSLYLNILAQDMNNYANYYNVALTYQAIGEMELAVANYKKAIRLNSSDIRSINNLARIYIDYVKDEKSACEYLDYAIEIAPTDAEAYNAYGNIYFNKQKYKTAKTYYKKSINFDKNYFKNYYDIAKAYIGLDDYKEAKKALNTCLKLNPDFELAKILLANVSK